MLFYRMRQNSYKQRYMNTFQKPHHINPLFFELCYISTRKSRLSVKCERTDARSFAQLDIAN